MKTVELKIEGLCCTSCAKNVEKALNDSEGVVNLKILMSSEKTIIKYDESKTDANKLVKRIEKLGHKVKDISEIRNLPEKEESQKKRDLFESVRFGFIVTVGIIVISLIGLQYLGIFQKAVDLIPLPIIIAGIIIGGYPIFKKALLGILNKQINVDLMMSAGILGATLISEYTASMLVTFFMNLAHYLEDFTVTRSRKAIKELIMLEPKTARIKINGRDVETDVSELKKGDIVIVRPGEKIPVDGVVIRGLSSVNQASITGESIPIEKSIGDNVFAGSINELGYLEIETKKVKEDTLLGKIIRLVEEAESNKAPIQKFADRFTTYFFPFAISFALLTYLISGKAIYAIAVIVAACPCAVGFATPLSVVASVASCAKRGLLIKGGLYLEALAKVDCIVMDKTGTVTFGTPKVTEIVTFNSIKFKELLKIASSIERYSEHPIASAIIKEAERQGIDVSVPDSFEYLIGRGIIGSIDGKIVSIGNKMLLKEKEIIIPQNALIKANKLEEDGSTAIFVAVDGEIVGIIAVSDVIRDEVYRSLDELRRLGIKRFIILTGDNETVARAVSKRLGIMEYKANLLPENKINMIKSLQAEGYKVCMIGDGVNDAPALAQADVGIAMAVAGSDVAIEASHVALMRDDWSQIPQAIKAGRNTYKIIRQGIALGIIWDTITMGLASVGILTPVMAAALEEIPTLAVAANASRLLINKK